MLENRFLPYSARYKQLRGIVEDSIGVKELPADLPEDDQLIVAGAGAGAVGAPEAADEASEALKGEIIGP